MHPKLRSYRQKAGDEGVAPKQHGELGCWHSIVASVRTKVYLQNTLKVGRLLRMEGALPT